jgi:hypothetical protein
MRGLIVTELSDSGSVGTLLLTNPLGVNVLLLRRRGARRGQAEPDPRPAVLVPGGAKTRLPVTCVERGRWNYRSSRFKPARRVAYPALRKARLSGGQACAWEDVAAKSVRLESWSPTEAVESMYIDRASMLDTYMAKLPRRDGQCGSIVCVAGRVVCLDLVSRSDVYAGLHTKLVRGYALDAVEQPLEAPIPWQYVKRLLIRTVHAGRAPAEQIGLGLANRLDSPRFSRVELRIGDELIALTAFPA